jgi:SAM-dependent methyltransferase
LRFERRLPSHQNAIDIFQGSWASDLTPILPKAISGNAAHFSFDPRPKEAANLLGKDGRLDGMTVLELGPLEGGHTYLLENLGADVLAIEANQDAFLKCLITKEISGNRRARFILGDFSEFLRSTDQRFDMVFAVGVLYHLADPIGVIKDICRITDRCFVWTHVYDNQTYNGPPRTKRRDPRLPTAELWEAEYGESVNDKRFWGGNKQINRWMRSEDVFMAFRHFGLSHFTVLEPSTANGHAAISFAAIRLT